MNAAIATYSVGVIGFERAERRDLRRVVGMSESRQPSFKPFDKGRDGFPHLIMVNADRPSAIGAWNKFRRANAHRGCFSPIFVGRNLTDLPCPDPYVLQRPILTTQLFAVFDQAVAEVHGFRPAASVLDRIVALTQHEIDKTMETTTILAPAAVTPVESTGSSLAQQAPEVSALVVDASLPVRVQMRRVLPSIASRVEFAETGERALELLDTHRYSLIFLDGTLPDEDAYEICGRIKRHPLHRDAVVVMLTCGASPADRVMGALAGFDNFLVKPVHPAMFNDLAAELVRPAAAL
jgi:twitching motility two-component system response regulator PilG